MNILHSRFQHQESSVQNKFDAHYPLCCRFSSKLQVSLCKQTLVENRNVLEASTKKELFSCLNLDKQELKASSCEFLKLI